MRKIALFTLVSAFQLVSCAYRIDRQSRNNFKSAKAATSKTTPNGEVEDERRPRQRGDQTHLQGWERVNAMVGRGIRLLSRSPGDERFERIANNLCQTTAKVEQTEHGVVRLCELDEPVIVRGHELSLELGGEGMLGLVLQDVDELESRRIVTDARNNIQDQCLTEFQRVPSSHASAARREEFYTCLVDGGSTLVVGRIPTPGTQTWQVSLAVVGAN